MIFRCGNNLRPSNFVTIQQHFYAMICGAGAAAKFAHFAPQTRSTSKGRRSLMVEDIE
jgi:hypothetical protein